MSAFEEFWVVEEDRDDDYNSMKEFAETYWDAAIKSMEADELSHNKVKAKIAEIVCRLDAAQNTSLFGLTYNNCVSELRQLSAVE